MTFDTREVNDLGQGKFRTQADSNTEQICYYNRNKKDTSFNSFLAVRQETSSLSEINFSIVKVIDNSNKDDNISSEISDELSDFKHDDVQRTVQRISESNTVRKTTKRLDRRREFTNNGRVRIKPRFLSR